MSAAPDAPVEPVAAWMHAKYPDVTTRDAELAARWSSQFGPSIPLYTSANPAALREAECSACHAMYQHRREEGARLRRIAHQLLTTHTLGALQSELSELADGLECGNPLGDCGCEGSCFTRGDSA